jgi:hypothetical protein
MGFNLDSWYIEKIKGDVIYKYKGNVTHDIIVRALKIIDESLEVCSENNKLKKKVFSVFVECIQNLFHHVDNPPEIVDSEQAENFGSIILARDAGYFYRLSTGNFVEINKVNKVKERIDQIRCMNEEDLKALYREVLGNREYSAKGGGGLGIIDIARKSGNKLDYNIFDYDNEYVFFELDIFIS